MTTQKAAIKRIPETFVVGETVAYTKGHGLSHRELAQVVAIENNTVIVEINGQTKHFKPRNTDGKHIRIGEDHYAIRPEMIYHRKKPITTMNTNTPNPRWTLKDIRDFMLGFFIGS
jgi:hypothetical protein